MTREAPGRLLRSVHSSRHVRLTLVLFLRSHCLQVRERKACSTSSESITHTHTQGYSVFSRSDSELEEKSDTYLI